MGSLWQTGGVLVKLIIAIWAIRVLVYPLAILLGMFGGRVAGYLFSRFALLLKKWNWCFEYSSINPKDYEKNYAIIGVILSTLLSFILSFNLIVEGDGSGLYELLVLSCAVPLALTVGLSGALLGLAKLTELTWVFAGALNSFQNPVPSMLQTLRSRRQKKVPACVYKPQEAISAAPEFNIDVEALAADVKSPVQKLLEAS
jgi:hypothetical protein